MVQRTRLSPRILDGQATRCCLKEIREARRIPVAELAKQVGVSRQTIYAIEDGSFVPNTTVALRLAQVLDVTVEELFSLNEAAPADRKEIRADLLAGERQQIGAGQLVQVCRLGKRLIATPVSTVPNYLPKADGVIDSVSRRAVVLRGDASIPEEAGRILVAGCDPALSLVSDPLEKSGIELVTVPAASRAALNWLKEGKVHAAGSHLRDQPTGEYNVPIVKRLFPRGAVRVVTFAAWEQGLLVARGNPKSIRSIADLSRKDVKIANREKGSGSRHVLDEALKKAGISEQAVNGYGNVVYGHLPAAFEVASGRADVCVAARSAAVHFGLHFIPLAEERFDLVIRKASLELPAIKAALDVLQRSALRRKLESLAGYDAAHTGDVLM